MKTEQATSNLEPVIILTDANLKAGFKIVDIAFEPTEVSIPQLSLKTHFNIASLRELHQAVIIVYTGKLGQRVFKCIPPNLRIGHINHQKFAEDILQDTDHRKDTMSQVEAHNIIDAYHIDGATQEDIDQIAELLITLYKAENELR